MLNKNLISSGKWLAIILLAMLVVFFQAKNAVSQPIESGVVVPGAPPTTSEVSCEDFKTASSNALKNHLTIVGEFMNRTEKSMQSVVNNSCINALAMLNFDLSSLIPDFNLFGAILQTALTKFTQYLTSRVCDAVNNVVGDWNSIVGTVTGNWTVNSAIESWGNGVIQNYPMGSGGSGISSGGGGTTVDIISPGDKSGTQCVITNVGKVCTDGSISGTGPAEGGGSNGSYPGGSTGGGSGGATTGPGGGATTGPGGGATTGPGGGATTGPGGGATTGPGGGATTGPGGGATTGPGGGATTGPGGGATTGPGGGLEGGGGTSTDTPVDTGTGSLQRPPAPGTPGISGAQVGNYYGRMKMDCHIKNQKYYEEREQFDLDTAAGKETRITRKELTDLYFEAYNACGDANVFYSQYSGYLSGATRPPDVGSKPVDFVKSGQVSNSSSAVKSQSAQTKSGSAGYVYGQESVNNGNTISVYGQDQRSSGGYSLPVRK